MRDYLPKYFCVCVCVCVCVCSHLLKQEKKKIHNSVFTTLKKEDKNREREIDSDSQKREETPSVL